MKFCVETWQKMKRSINRHCSKQALLFHLLEQFAKLKKTHCMNILILKNQIQDLVSANCGQFQLCFYKTYLIQMEKVKL